MKLHLLGPSGSGTTSVGKALSIWLKAPFFDSDDFFWKTTAVPYTEKRSREERAARLRHMLESNESWILSGSALGWGDILLEQADIIILLYCNKEERKRRLEERERRKYGNRLLKTGDMYDVHREFINWAMNYDEGGLDMRSLKSEEAWVQRAQVPVLRITNEIQEKTVKRILEVTRLD